MSIIIFGASGQVGSNVARSAQAQGVTTILAMRDTAKPISGLDKSAFRTVRADLSDASSVAEAVSTTEATKAFVYVAFGADLEPALQAMKNAGVQYVVFLSTASILGAPEEVKPKEVIAFVHARAEMQLQRVFGDKGFVSVRPGWFASNTLQFDFQATGTGYQARVFKPDDRFDSIAPIDIAVVCTELLIHGSKENFLYLSGPEMLSQREAVGVIGSVLGRKIDVVAIDADERRQQLSKAGIPPAIWDHLIEASPDEMLANSHAPGKENWTKFSNGKPATSLKDWVLTEKSKFEAKFN